MRRHGRRWGRILPWVLIVCILAGCASALYMQRYETPVYRAVYTLYAVAHGDSASTFANTRMLARDCQLLTRTDTFRRSVLANTVSDGKTFVEVRAAAGTHMLEVVTSGPDAAVVQGLANAVGDALLVRIPRLFQAEGVREIERAALPQETSAPQKYGRIAAVMLVVLAGGFLLTCCLPEPKEKLSFSSPDAEVFSLGGVGDTRRMVKRFLKYPKPQGTLLQLADPLLREEIRRLVLVLRSTSEKRGRSLVITAMRPDEEEAALCVLLGSEMAQQGFRVLLMEMDAQKPALARLLGVRARADLCDYLNGRAELSEVIQHTPFKALSLIDSLHPASCVADLAATASFAEFIRSAEEHFDFVILHAAPRAVSSDASMLGFVTGATLLAARDGQYTLQEMEAAARDMVRLGKAARGVVFTRVRAQ